MPRRSHRRFVIPAFLLTGAATAVVRLAGHVHRSLRHWRRRAPIEVLTADRARRVALTRELDRGLRRLQRVLGDTLPRDLAIVAQHVIATDRQLAGCYQVGQRPDGTRFALIRLALQVNGRRLTTDELLAVLAEKCIALATQAGSATVLVPIDLDPAPAAEARRLPPLPADPLVSSPNGVLRPDPRGPDQRHSG